jgi:hypothetical protein
MDPRDGIFIYCEGAKALGDSQLARLSRREMIELVSVLWWMRRLMMVLGRYGFLFSNVTVGNVICSHDTTMAT